MCAHCDTILDVIRDAEVVVLHTNDGGEGFPVVFLDFTHGDKSRARVRSKALDRAMSKMCGARKFVEVEARPVKPRPSQKGARHA